MVGGAPTRTQAADVTKLPNARAGAALPSAPHANLSTLRRVGTARSQRRMYRFALALLLALAACQPDPTPPTGSSGPPRFVIREGGRYGYMDAGGQVVIPARYEMAEAFHEGLALVQQNGQFGYINAQGEEVIAPQFEDAWHFSEGLAPVQVDGRWGYINRTGRLVIEAQFDLAPGMMEAQRDTTGPTRVRVGTQYGFVQGGDTLIRPQFDQAWHFRDGLARVRKGGLWGFIDAQGEEVIPAQFDQAWDFENGLARVEAEGRLGYIDRAGRYLWREGAAN